MECVSKNAKVAWCAALLALVLIVAVMFSAYFVSGRVLAPTDITHEMYLPWRGNQMFPSVHNHFVTDAALHYIPYRMLAAQAFEQDGYVGWNPLLFGGTAQYANTMLISHDWSVQLHKFAPFWPAWTLGRMGQFLLAGLGMLLFLGGRGCAPGTALLGAVAYMMNHQFVAWIYFNQVVASFCWLPFVLWAVSRSIERSYRYVAAAACFLAMALLGATLQQMAFVLAAMACGYCGLLIDGRSGSVCLRATVTFACAGVLGAGLVAFMLEPAIHAFLENERAGHGRGGFSYEYGALQPLLHAAASPLTAFPSLLGSVATLDLWKILKFDIFNLGFFGTVPMVLACIALFTRGIPSGAKLLMLAGVLVPLSPLVGYLYHRFNVLWIFGGCWAACAWLAAASPETLRRASKWMAWSLVTASFVWFLASLGILRWHERIESALQAKVAAASSASAFGIFREWMLSRASALLDYLCIWNPWQLSMLAGTAISIWGLRFANSAKGVARFAAAAGVALQLGVFWWQWTTWSKPESIYERPALASFLKQEVGQTGRLAMEPAPWAEGMFPPNMLMPSGVAITGGYDAIQPLGLKSPTGKSWDFPGATHFLGRIGSDGPADWDQIWSDGRWHVLRNPMPSAGRVSSDAGEVALGRERFARPTPNTMRVVAPAGATRLMLYSNWHHGWRWRDPFDGLWKPAEQSEMRSVQVTFGRSLLSDTRIEFRFFPSSSAWTRALTLASLLGVAVVAVYGRWRIKA